MAEKKKLTTNAGAPVVDHQNIMTAGSRGPALLHDVWFAEKLAHFDREVIPEHRMHAKGLGAHGTFTVTHDITRHTKTRVFSTAARKTELFENTARALGNAPREVKVRHIGNCMKTDPAYGEGVARALGIPTSEIET